MKIKKVKSCETCDLFTAEAGRCSPTGSNNPAIYVVGGAANWSIKDFMSSFGGEDGRVFKTIVNTLKSRYKETATLQLRYQHATQCYSEDVKANTEIIKKCSSLLKSDIYNTRPKVILALGTESLRALGIEGSIDANRGADLVVTIGDVSIPVVASYHPSILVNKTKVGKTKDLEGDITRAMKIAVGKKRHKKSLAELTQDYKICYTADELGKAVDMALASPNIMANGQLGPAEQNLIAIDTETAVEDGKYSALNPWVPGFKCIAFSFAWGEGQSAAVLLDHRKNDQKWEDCLPHIVRLLSSRNPKTFHNAKYDIQVLECHMGLKINNLIYDSMMGEYLLNENNAGSYGLKAITKTRVPAFHNYEELIKDDKTEAKDRIKVNTEAMDGLNLSKSANFNELTKMRVTKKVLIAEGKLLSKKADAEAYLSNKEAKLMIAEQITAGVTRNKQIAADIKGIRESIKDDTKIVKNRLLNFEDYPVDKMLLYAAIDTDISWRIAKQQIAEMKVDKSEAMLFTTLTRIMMPTCFTLARMEYRGVKIDLEYLEEFKSHLEEFIIEKEQLIYQTVGRKFNINSGPEIINILVMDYGIKLEKKTRGGMYAVDKEVLSKLAKEHPVAKTILDYREAYKARHTFLEGIMTGGKNVNAYGCSIDGRVHGSYNQTVAATGRLSSSSPNMQNFPLYLAGWNVKKLFTVDDHETEVMVQADYSAAEVRVLTAYAPDPELIKVLESGKDMHSHVGSKVFGNRGLRGTPGVTYDELKNRAVNKDSNPKEYARLDEMRQVSKMVVFLTIFGGQAMTLNSNLEKAGTDLSMAECEKVMDALLVEFPAIKRYMKLMRNTVNKVGYVQTYTGRKRRFPMAKHSFKMRNAAHREAINSPIQGTSSDIVTFQMCEVEREAEKQGLRIKLYITVHDSIVFGCHRDDLYKLVAFLNVHLRDNVRKNFPFMPVEFAYDVEHGPNYGEAKIDLKEAEFDEFGTLKEAV